MLLSQSKRNPPAARKWKTITQKVQKPKTLKQIAKQASSMDLLENKFCSENAKQELAKMKTAPYCTHPSQQHGASFSLPPMKTRASFDDRERAIHQRLKRKRSTISASHVCSNTTLPMTGSSTPRIPTQEEKDRLRNKFKGLVRVFLAFKRIWMYHKGRVDEILQTFKGLDSLVKTSVGESQLLFNLSHFKAKKQSTVNKEVKKILSKHPTLRTDDEIHTLIVFMASYRTLSEYPMAMQRMIAQRAWYEWYDAKRVIVREGHVAYSFFYILSGSAVMTSFDQTSTQSKTVRFVGPGDSFGDSCLMNGCARECTTISKEFIELLVLRDEDFAEIFMSGGLRNNKDTFLESLSFMEDWPLELLQSEKSPKAVSTYYRKGTVIMNDSSTSDFIYIIKSGCCSLLKKLKDVELRDADVKAIRGKDNSISHVEALAKKFNDTKRVENLKEGLEKRLKKVAEKHRADRDKMQRMAYYDPDINIPMNSVLNELRGVHKRRPLPPIPRQSSLNNLPANTTREDSEPKDVYIAMELNYVPQLKYKGLGHSSKESSMMKPRLHTLPDIPEVQEEYEKTISATKHREGGSNSNATNMQQCLPGVEKDGKEVFITVKMLKPGSHFGLLEAIAGDTIAHPSLSLVSHGAECVMIHKKLYMENAPLKLLDKLREELFPYPSDEQLKENLQVRLFWNKHKQEIMNSWP